MRALLLAGPLYHRRRLGEDHENARALAIGIAGVAGLEVDAAGVETNIVVVRTLREPAGDLARRLAAAGVLVLASGLDTIRAVTSLEVDAHAVGQAAEIIRRTAAGGRA